jgi:hypothetical protein
MEAIELSERKDRCSAPSGFFDSFRSSNHAIEAILASEPAVLRDRLEPKSGLDAGCLCRLPLE